MAITIPKPKSPAAEAAAAAFIGGAPDATPVVAPAEKVRKGVIKGNKQQISLTIAPALLNKVDELAANLGQSRAAVIGMAIHRAVEHGLVIDALAK